MSSRDVHDEPARVFSPLGHPLGLERDAEDGAVDGYAARLPRRRKSRRNHRAFRALGGPPALTRRFELPRLSPSRDNFLTRNHVRNPRPLWLYAGYRSALVPVSHRAFTSGCFSHRRVVLLYTPWLGTHVHLATSLSVIDLWG